MMGPLPDSGIPLILNWEDYSDLREWVDRAQNRCMHEFQLPAAADRAICAWLQWRGFRSLSRFYLQQTQIVVDQRAERFTVFRDEKC